jgi:hypothetical protein
MSREAFEVCAETMAMTDTHLSPAELRGEVMGGPSGTSSAAASTVMLESGYNGERT